jgi:putative redox protein
MTNPTSTVSIKWITSHLMAGIDSRGTPIVIGTWPEQETQWTGMKASDLLLMAAASCSTYDVASILNKQREPLESLECRCTGEQEVDPPHRFLRMHLHFLVKGAVKPERIKRAIALSEEKYCSVINTLRPGVEIICDYELV